MTADNPPPINHAITSLRGAARDTRARMADAVELRRRAAPVVAMYRAKRIAVYSLDDAAALRAFAEYVEALDAGEGQ